MIRVPTLQKWLCDVSYPYLVQMAEEETSIRIVAKTYDGTIVNTVARLCIPENCDIVYAILENGVWHALWPQEQARISQQPSLLRYNPPDTLGLVSNQPTKKAAGWP